MVSESLVPHSPLLSTLLLMDNDISTVADGALDLVEDLKQLDLTGNIQDEKFDWDDLIWFFLSNLAISNLLNIKHTSIVFIAFKRSHHIVSSLNWWPTREWASKCNAYFPAWKYFPHIFQLDALLQKTAPSHSWEDSGRMPIALEREKSENNERVLSSALHQVLLIIQNT